jgi:hypothetical protein
MGETLVRGFSDLGVKRFAAPLALLVPRSYNSFTFWTAFTLIHWDNTTFQFGCETDDVIWTQFRTEPSRTRCDPTQSETMSILFYDEALSA